MSWTPKTFVADDDSGASKEWQPKSFVADDEDNKSGILNDILQAGGTAGRAIGYGLADVMDVPVAVANYANQKVAGLFGVKPENVPTPDLFDPSKLSMPFVSQEKQSQLDPLARRLTTGAELATPAAHIAKLGLSLTSAGGKALLGKLKNASFVKNMTGKNIEEATQKFEGEAKNALQDLFGSSKVSPQDELAQNTHETLEKMYGTPDYKNMIGKENENLSQAVYNAHAQNRQTASDRFDKTLADTNPIVSPEEAHIKPREGDKLGQAMKMDPLLADKIITANDKPTLRNLHEVQSQMGAMIADKKSVPYSQRDNESIKILSNLRDKIINNISNHAPEYKNDQQFFKKNVLPYYENASINKLVRKEVPPANISNILSKPELPDKPNKIPGTVNTILRHLTPLQKQQIPLAKLAGTQERPLMDLGGNINPENFAKSAQGLTAKNIQQFITPEVKQKLLGLGQDLKDAQLHEAITKNVQDVSGKVNPDQLVKNIQSLDSSLINPSQKAALNQSLAKLINKSEGITKQQEKTDAIMKLLKRSGWIAGGLGLGEGIRKIF